MFSRFILMVCLLGAGVPAAGQIPNDPAEPRFALTLEDAVSIALERNYAIRSAELDVATADAQVRETWGTLLPQVEGTSTYTRNVISPNPFAGSDAGGLFNTIGLMDWLAFNERARTDEDAETEPISLEEFRRRQAEGYEQAGVSLSPSDNPFAVPNQFLSQISVNQTLYSSAAFAALRGARSLREISQAALTVQQHGIIHQVRELYYTALLAEQQAQVSLASVRRAEETRSETARRVAAGTLPLFERLSAEVELTNLQTQLLQVENQASLTRSNLLFALGLPVDAPLRLEGELALPDDPLIEFLSMEDALAAAYERRPELRQAELAVDLQEINRDITRGSYFPTVSAFATLGYQGTVPDNRTVIQQGTTPGDPFGVTVEERGFFDSSYWNPSLAVGARLSWNLFDGFQTRYRVQQSTIEIEQARIVAEQTRQSITLEVEQALRSLHTAARQIEAQDENVARAETAYQFASTRLASGVSTQIDVRMASAQLDQARLGFLQAVYDYLVARSELQRAVGVILPEPGLPTGFSLNPAE